MLEINPAPFQVPFQTQTGYEARIAAGQSAETASQMANDMARHWIALIYVRDSWVVNRIIRGE
jgi:hypothetical protein